jgi:plastocyanin
MSVRALAAAAALAVAASAALAASATREIVMEAVAFKPASITVNAGDTIQWVNRDAFPHTATANDKRFDSGEIAPGATWKLVAKEKGTFAYLCAYHPTMKGTLVVR